MPALAAYKARLQGVVSVSILPTLNGSGQDQIGGDLCKMQRLFKDNRQWAVGTRWLVNPQHFITQCYFVLIDTAEIST